MNRDNKPKFPKGTFVMEASSIGVKIDEVPLRYKGQVPIREYNKLKKPEFPKGILRPKGFLARKKEQI